MAFLFLLGFAGALYGIYFMKLEWITAEGTNINVRKYLHLPVDTGSSVWLAVLSGAFIVYPRYRATPPEGLTDLTNFPKFLILANPSIAFCHNLGMEWKEHILVITHK